MIVKRIVYGSVMSAAIAGAIILASVDVPPLWGHVGTLMFIVVILAVFCGGEPGPKLRRRNAAMTVEAMTVEELRRLLANLDGDAPVLLGGEPVEDVVEILVPPETPKDWCRADDPAALWEIAAGVLERAGGDREPSEADLGAFRSRCRRGLLLQ